MTRLRSSTSTSLRARLSSIDSYLGAIEELRLKLLHFSPSYLNSEPEKLISLVEVAKNTLQSKGIILHTFSSCPSNLAPYKAAYFGLLLQLRDHGHTARLESKDHQDRLNRLLFPLYTQLKVCGKGVKDTPGCNGTDRARMASDFKSKFGSSDSYLPANKGQLSKSRHLSLLSRTRFNDPPTLPPNVMLPPDVPIHRTAKSYGLTSYPSAPFHERRNRLGTGTPVSMTRSNSMGGNYDIHKTSYSSSLLNHGYLKPPKPIGQHSRLDLWGSSSISRQKKARSLDVDRTSRIKGRSEDSDSDEWSEDDSDDMGAESEEEDEGNDVVSQPAVPSLNSPLKLKFGIFCTGKDRGAVNGPRPYQRSLRRQEALAR